MSKGSVSVEVFKNRLRLVWWWQGKRFYLYVGLPDTQANRKAAEIKARQIELDIASGNFDPSLVKYKPQRETAIAVTELFAEFVEYKRRHNTKASLAKYVSLQGYITQFFKSKAAIAITETAAENFRDWLLEKLESVTVRERIVFLNACWQWAIKKKLLWQNP